MGCFESFRCVPRCHRNVNIRCNTLIRSSAAAYFKAQGGLLLLNGAVMALSLLLCARMGHSLLWIIVKGITCAAVTVLLYTLALGRTAEYRWMLEKGQNFLRKWRKKKA